MSNIVPLRRTEKMEAAPLDGRGILSGLTSLKPTAAERERSRSWQEYAKEVEEVCDQIKLAALEYLLPYIRAEKEKKKITPRMRQDFDEFTEYCQSFSPPVPYFPTTDEIAAAWLIRGLNERPLATTLRIARSISTVHKAAGRADPLDDLSRAVLALARDNANKPPEPKEAS
jgi:hypothetical protein